MHPILKSFIVNLVDLTTISINMTNEMTDESANTTTNINTAITNQSILPEEELAALQMNLFSLLDSPTDPTSFDSIYSNSIASIDLVPRFRRGVNKAIKSTEIKPNQSLIIENRYHIGQHELICRIQPAIIRHHVDGIPVEYHAYPGDREELIEKVLFLIAANKGLELRNTAGGIKRYGVSFTLYEIREELKKIGKTKSYDVIREALTVIRDSKIIISQKQDKKEITITHNVFADAALEVEGKGRARNRCFITFSDYVVTAIQSLNYRQYPFGKVHAHKATLARFLHSYLTAYWLNANIGVLKQLSTNAIMEAFGKSGISMPQKRRDLREAMSLLVQDGWFTHVPTAKKVQQNNIVDYIYFLEPTTQFVEDIKQANAKAKGLRIINNKLVTGETKTLPDAKVY